MTQPFVLFYAANAGALSSMMALDEAPQLQYSRRWFVDDVSTNLISSSDSRHIHSGSIFNFINTHSNNTLAVVLGPQHKTEVTERVINTCNKANVPTVFVTDHWGRNAESICLASHSMETPTLVLAIDDSVVSELTSTGFQKQQIRIVGHLGIQRKLDLMNQMLPEEIEKKRRKLGGEKEAQFVLLVLEDISRVCSDASDQYWMIYDVWSALKSNIAEAFHFMVKPHPSDNKIACAKYIHNLQCNNDIFLLPDELEDWIAVAVSDIVIGSNTALLALSAAHNAPTISITYGPGARSTIPTVRNYRVDNASKLASAIRKCSSNEWPEKKIDHPFGDINKAWREIGQLISNNLVVNPRLPTNS